MEVLRRALPLAALLLAGCEFTRGPVTVDVEGEELMVHAILASGSDTVAVLLTRVLAGGDAAAAAVEPVSDATVRIAGGGRTVRLDEAPVGFPPCTRQPGVRAPAITRGCYAAVLPGGVRSGTTYQLDVRVDGRAPVRGSATVPAVPTIHAPAPGSPFGVRRSPAGAPSAAIPVRWSGAGDGGGIGVGLAVTAVYSLQARVADAICTIPQNAGPRLSPIADSATITLYHPALCQTPAGPVEPDSVHARLLVVSYDTAYARYAAMVEAGKPLPRERLAAGISGALGLFAGVAVAELPVTLVPVD